MKCYDHWAGSLRYTDHEKETAYAPQSRPSRLRPNGRFH